jgi:hypothetical protein
MYAWRWPEERSKHVALTSEPIKRVVDTVVFGSFQFQYMLCWLPHFIFFLNDTQQDAYYESWNYNVI